jgi:chromosome segregation ATPase
MVKRLIVFLFIAFVFSLFLDPLKCAGAFEDKPRVFTNQDIKKYKSSSDSITTDTKTVFQEDGEGSRESKNQRIMEEHEMEYWCKRASAYKKKIKEADGDVKEIEQEISEESSKSPRSSKKKTKLRQNKLEKAKKRLTDAEADLGELEDEAHRKGVKPGWLRCQL